MYQRVEIIGRIGSRENRYTPSGTFVASLSVAVSYKERDRDDYATAWFRVSYFGERAESLKADKGDVVFVEGRLAIENGGPPLWEDRDGNTKASFEIIASNVRLISRKQREGDAESRHGNDADEPF